MLDFITNTTQTAINFATAHPAAAIALVLGWLVFVRIFNVILALAIKGILIATTTPEKRAEMRERAESRKAFKRLLKESQDFHKGAMR